MGVKAIKSLSRVEQDQGVFAVCRMEVGETHDSPFDVMARVFELEYGQLQAVVRTKVREHTTLGQPGPATYTRSGS